MNRIYQGRVSGAQLIDEKGEPIADENFPWESALWEHHALFQDAVNYYLVCLLALANDPKSDPWKIRQRMTMELSPDTQAANPFYVWGPFRRRSVTRQGMRESVARYFTPGNDAPTFEQCAAAVLTGNEVDPAILNLALEELLFVCAGANPIKNQGGWMLTRFCVPGYNGGFPFDATAALREAGELRLSTELHELHTQSERETFAAEVETAWVVNPTKGAPPFSGEASRERLRKAVAHFLQSFGEPSPGTKMGDRVANFLAGTADAPSELRALLARINEMPAEGWPVIPANNRSIPDRLEACILFKYFPGSFTAELLKVSFPRREQKAGLNKADESTPEARFCRFGGDAIELARGVRGYVFRAFTSLPCWGGAENSAELRWKEFDIAAFKYALTALHQVDDKGEERRTELKALQARHDYQRGRARRTKSDGQSDVVPPVLAGDPRIERLEALLKSDLAAEYAMSEGVPVEYGLRPRTIRGFRDLRKIWNGALRANEGYSDAACDKLWSLLTDYKKENASVIGSPVLFDALVEEPNWIIWREPDADLLKAWRKAAKLPDDADFAADPLQALTDEREIIEEMKRLAEPIRLTPADPAYSRRQFYFSDVVKFTERGDYRHEPNQCTVIVPLALRDGAQWREVRVRLHYTAPRLLREGLRGVDGENLSAMPWLQPMMAALGLREPLPQDFRDCPVALMPDFAASGERRILLNFPLTLEPEPLARQLRKAARWDDMQFGPNFKNSCYLHWPATWDKKAKSSPWWKSAEPFRFLAVDLGQRDAGAFAQLRAQPGEDFGVVKAGNRKGERRHSRFIGEADGQRWFAAVEAAGMLRLPGEDAHVWRGGQWQEELSGERGRLATAAEWVEAKDICRQLGLDPERVLGSDPPRYSFPESNDRLNFALRRAQARLARLQSWSCLADAETKEERRARILAQIKDSIDAAMETDGSVHVTDFDKLALALKPLVEKGAADLVAAKIIAELEKLRALIPQQLVRVADRIQPLRGRRWEWAKRDDDSGCHVLRQTERGTDDRKKLLAGQRGLSMERIAQLEEFRHRCQSLNRALLQTPGKPAKLGRSKRGIELPDPCPELLDRLDALKEQRVNQTAHLILAQALGVRLRPHDAADRGDRETRHVHGEYERIPGREPVDFIVLENLDRYLATQGRSRGENSRLMKWCHRQILGKVKQLGEPYGLRVLETAAAYSSRFCSRTGTAGFRAIELTPDDALEFRWRKHLDRLDAEARGEKKLSREERDESQQVRSLFDQLAVLNANLIKDRPARPKWRTLLAPVAGGPIFVPMRGAPQQADINAAVNLGLRALAAPDNHEIHMRLRSERKSDAFFVRADNLREKARWPDGGRSIVFERESDQKAMLTEARPNFFADLGGVANFDCVTITGLPCRAASGRGLWGTINQQDWVRVNEINRQRVRKKGDVEDDIPM